MPFDPYQILGLSRDAGPDDLKRAYRRLAMRWHPDRNDHPEAAERFKEVRAAYDHLLGSEDAVASPDRDDQNEAPENVLKAADIRLNLDISLEEAAAGCRKSIHFVRGKACETCDGSGESGLARTRFCGACHGSGRVRDTARTLLPCDACGGRGFFTQRICPDCAGKGRQTGDVNLEITVPPAMLSGDDLRLAGQGDPAHGELQAGDLFVTLVLSDHPLFTLRERDLHFSMPVSALAMMAGGEIEVPSLHGRIKHQLPAGAVESCQIRWSGKGYPGRGRIAAGDLVVTLQPVFPQRLDARQRKLLLQVNAALLDQCAESLPEIAHWQDKYGKR